MDQNDEIPFFRGRDPITTFIEASVQENLAAGAVVTTLAAADEDIDARFKQVSSETSVRKIFFFLFSASL